MVGGRKVAFRAAVMKRGENPTTQAQSGKLMLSDSRELGVVSLFPFSLKVGQRKLAVIWWEKCKEGKQAENLHERRLLPPLPSSSCSIAWGSDSIGSSFSITSSHPSAELHSPLVCTLLASNSCKVA